MKFACEVRLFEMIWGALISEFTFLLSGAEIRNLKRFDLNICIEGGTLIWRFVSRGVRLTRRVDGVFRTLFRNGTALCPCYNWEAFSSEIIQTKHETHSFTFARNILDLVRTTIIWIASSLGIDAGYFPSHSLRSGGASTLSTSRIELEIIPRFGRWRSNQFLIFLYGDSLNFRKLRSVMRQENNLTIQFKMSNDLRTDAAYEERRKLGRGGSFLHRVGGCQSDEIARNFAQIDQSTADNSLADNRSLTDEEKFLSDGSYLAPRSVLGKFMNERGQGGFWTWR